ncbi:MAG: cobalamin biosynthesis protein, partial [Eubacterium sp.]|nr:cobalamin biosynthesis protein [Eubacterium sp.]
ILYLRPRTICAGIGCKKGMEAAPIEAALLDTLKKEGLSPLSLKCISTIPLKATEAGILSTASRLNVPLQVIPTEDIESLDIQELGISASEFVEKQTGVLSVSTASSYLASGGGTILVDKAKYKGITIALSKVRLFQ